MILRLKIQTGCLVGTSQLPVGTLFHVAFYQSLQDFEIMV